MDHIYPQSKIKDDSIDNRVLVKRGVNAKKSNDYPLSESIRNHNKGFWYSLEKKGYISKTKLDRLVRTTDFTDDELASFISRQLVETRQSTKAVATILKRVFDKSEIVYVKARNVSSFRQNYNLIKVREINDFHHAKDAYLNIVVGNVYHTKFTSNPIRFISKDKKNYSLNGMYKNDVERDGLIAWKAGSEGSITHIKKVMKKNNILFTRYASEMKGGFFDQMIPRLSNIERYGAYNKVSGAYFMLVEHQSKKKTLRTMEYVPVYLARKLFDDESARIDYCENTLGLVKPTIIIPRVKINALLEIEGVRLHLSGRSGSQLSYKGANQLCIGLENEAYFKKVIKHVNKTSIPITPFDHITREDNLKMYELLLDKLKNTVYSKRLSAQIDTFEKGRERFEGLTIENQCVLLYEALHLFQCNSVTAKLTLIGGAARAGIIKTQKNVGRFKEIFLINQRRSILVNCIWLSLKAHKYRLLSVF